MKQCVKFPEDKFLAVRTCLVAICMSNRPAANLLSILLFRYNLRMENKDDAENQNAVKASKGESPDQDTSVRIFRTQAQLVEDMCGEITEKTLHDTAVPMLQLLGFLDLEEHMIANCYILHVELVQQALSLYLPGKKEQPQLENFLIEHMQLENFLITSDELENFLINRKIFQSGLEKVLIQNRKFSNQQRGRRLSADVPLRGKRRLPKKREEDNKKNVEEERESVSASASTPRAFDDLSEKDGEEDTKPQPIVAGRQFKQVAQHTSSQARVERDERTDGPATVGIGSEPAASDDTKVTQGKPKRQRKEKPAEEMPQEVTRILDDWDTLQKKPVPRTPRLIAAAQTLVARNPSCEELRDCRNWLPTTDRPGKPWYRLHGVGLWDIAEKIGQWDSLDGMAIEPAPLADMKPLDKYAAASMDPERNRRNIERMEQRIAEKQAREAAQEPRPPSYADEAPAQTRMRLAKEAAARQQGGTHQS